MSNSRVLIISDLHAPYHHPDAIRFLAAIKKKYKPDRVINIGDEVDYHAMSFHDSDPDLRSASDELQEAILAIRAIESLFPKVDVIESNHGSLAYRRAKAHGFPRQLIRPYKEVLGTPGWNWHFDLTITLSNGQKCYFVHSKGANVLQVSQSMGMCVIQGHHHEKFGASYWSNPLALNWGFQVGCLIDKDSLAFEYGKSNLKRPIIGCGMIIDGQPRPMPMILKKGGRWTGKLV